MIPRHHALGWGGLLALTTLTALAMVTTQSRAHTQPEQSAHHCFWKVASPTAVLYLFGSVLTVRPNLEVNPRLR